MVLTFGAPAAVVVALEPLTAPVAALLAAHGAAVIHIQAGRGARAVVPIGSARSAARAGAPARSPSGSRSACSATCSATPSASCWPGPGWRCSAGGSAYGWSARRAR